MNKIRLVNPTSDRMGEFLKVVSIHGNDFVDVARHPNGTQVIGLSLSPYGNNEGMSIVSFAKPLRLPMSSEIELSVSGRDIRTSVICGLSSIETLDAKVSHNVTSITQSNNIITAVIDTEFDGVVGSWATINGSVDTRLNHSNLCVSGVGIDRKTITFEYAGDTQLSVSDITATGLSNVTLTVSNLEGSTDTASIRLSGDNSNTMSPYVRFDASAPKMLSGNQVGPHIMPSGSSDLISLTSGNNLIGLKATTKYVIDMSGENTNFLDNNVGSSDVDKMRGGIDTVRPNKDLDYYFNVSGEIGKASTRIISSVVSAVKTGTNSTTIATTKPHGLAVGNTVALSGLSDSVTFGGTGLVTSVVNANVFVADIGSSGTKSSYGGALILVNGEESLPGTITESIQDITRGEYDVLTVVTTTNWNNTFIGDYIELVGVFDSSESTIEVDGSYEVIGIDGISIHLAPITAMDNTIITDGNQNTVSPSGDTIATISTAGLMVRRTTIRIHDVLITSYDTGRVRIDGQGTNRPDMAIPTFNVGETSSEVLDINTVEGLNNTVVKAAGGRLYNAVISNLSSKPIYIKLYNKASSIIVATDVPSIVIPVKAMTTLPVEFGNYGISFTNGISMIVSNGASDDSDAATEAGNKLVLGYI